MEKIKTFNKNENFQLLKSVSSLLVFLEDKLNLKTNVALIPDGIKFTCNTKSEWRSPFGLGIHLVFKLILSEETATVQLCEYNKIYRIVLFFIGVAWLCDEKSAFLGFVLAALSVTGTFMLKRTVRKIFHAFDDNISKEPKECTPQKIEEFANKLSLSGICVLAEKIEKETPGDSFELYKIAAAKKNTKACIKLGDFYYNGEFVTKDLKKAFEYWSACEQNLDADTSLKFADMYRNGEGTEKDLKKAFQFYQNASKENFVQRIVEIYEQGTDLPEYLKAVASIYEERFDAGEKQILDKIIEIYTKLNDSENIQKWQSVKAKNGDGDLALSLGKKLYEEGKKESVELLTIAAQKEDPVALRMLGEAYWNGDLVQEDDEKAIPLLQKAAQKGSLNAAEILVIHYDEYDEDDVKLQKALEQEIALFESGKYVDKDEDFSLADELYELAWLYCSGGEESEIPRNVSKGIDLFLKAIELGDSDSYLSLAEIYSEEEYGTVDYDKAIKYCQKAVEANVENAEEMLKDIQTEQKNAKQQTEFLNMLQSYKDDVTGEISLKLAKAYEKGIGVKKDISQAITLYQDSAEKGVAEAMFLLGKIYMIGKNVKNKEEEAVILLEKACTAGEKNAKKFLETNKEKLFLARLKNFTENNAETLRPQSNEEIENSLLVTANETDLICIQKRLQWIFNVNDDNSVKDILEKRYNNGSVISGLLWCTYYIGQENNIEVILAILDKINTYLTDNDGIRYRVDPYGCTSIECKIVESLYVVWRRLSKKSCLSEFELDIVNKLFKFFFMASSRIPIANDIFLESILASACHESPLNFSEEELSEKFYEYGINYFLKNNGKWTGVIGICYPYHIMFSDVYHWRTADYKETDAEVIIGSNEKYAYCVKKFEDEFAKNPNGDNALKLAAIYASGAENSFVIEMSNDDYQKFSMIGSTNYSIDSLSCEKIEYYLKISADKYNNAIAQCILGDLYSEKYSELDNIGYDEDIGYGYYTKSALNGCEIAAIRMIRKWKKQDDIIHFATQYLNVFSHTQAADELRSKLLNIFIDTGKSNNTLWNLIVRGSFDLFHYSDFDEEDNLFCKKLADAGCIEALISVLDDPKQDIEEYIVTGQKLARNGYIDAVLYAYAVYLNGKMGFEQALKVSLFGCSLHSELCYELTGGIYCEKDEFDKAVEYFEQATTFHSYMILAQLSLKGKLRNRNEESGVFYSKQAFIRTNDEEEKGKAASFAAIGNGLLFLKEFSKTILKDQSKANEYFQQMNYWFNKAKEYESFIAQEIVDNVAAIIEEKKQKQEQYAKFWKYVKQTENMIKQEIEDFNKETQDAIKDLEPRSDDYLIEVAQSFLSSKYKKIAARKLLKDRGFDISNL